MVVPQRTQHPYLSPAAVKRWEPFIDEIVRAAIDERIESGRIDFVDDLANVVPAVFTLAMMGIPRNVEQLRASLAGLSAEQIADAVIAYEPVWAIGTGRVASPAAQEVCAAIRERDERRVVWPPRSWPCRSCW